MNPLRTSWRVWRSWRRGPDPIGIDEIVSKRDTTDRTDPRLGKIRPDGQQEAYLVLSAEERAKGFVRPVRRSYRHEKCGSVTSMGQSIAETYARNPSYYGGTFCVHCRAHFPVGKDGEFTWVDGGSKVGT